MGALSELKNQWYYHGPRATIGMAYEKLVLDKKRYSGRFKSETPSFPTLQTSTPREQFVDMSKKIAVLYVIHYFYPEKQGGAERFVLSQAKAQQKMGNSVHVLTLSALPKTYFDNSCNGMLYTSFEYEGVPVTRFRYDKAPCGLYYKRIDENDVVMESFAKETINRIKPDIVHCAYGQPMAAFLKYCREIGLPYVMTLTGYDCVCHYTTMVDKNGRLCTGCEKGLRCARVCKTYGIQDYEARYRYAESYLRGAYAIAAPSDYVANAISYQFSNIDFQTIRHGITPVSEKKRSGKVLQFAYLGTLTGQKGLEVVIRAFRNMPRDATLSIYGRGATSYLNRLRSLIGNDERIKLMGSVPNDQVTRIYEENDCMIVASVVPETYNFVVREALNCGCLVIATDIGALTEAVAEGENGFLVKAGSEKELEMSMMKALEFDWNTYKRVFFSTPQEESQAYNELYYNAVAKRLCII